MTQYTRPATIEDVKSLIAALNAQGADYLLIGGYALFAHGYHRSTEDIALLIPATCSSGERIKRALLVMPDRAIENIDLSWFEEGENIRIADEYVVDLMFNACGESFESLQKFAEEIDFEGIPIRTLSLEGLLCTKQTVREKDAMDRAVIEHALEIVRQNS